MTTGDFSVEIRGLEELRTALLSLGPKLRKRAIRNALAAAARIIRDAARAGTPLLKTPNRFRTRGTVRNAISVRTSKVARRAGDIGVFVNVRPAKGAARGAKSPTDPFYWRWLEFGAGKNSFHVFTQPSHMLRNAATSKAGEALKKFETTLGPQVQKLNTPKAEA